MIAFVFIFVASFAHSFPSFFSCCFFVFLFSASALFIVLYASLSVYLRRDLEPLPLAVRLEIRLRK